MSVSAESSTKTPLFSGAFTALITPMDANGRVDDDALKRLVERQIEGGIHGLVPVGTTGESATLSPAEHIHVVRLVTETVRGRVPVLAGAVSGTLAALAGDPIPFEALQLLVVVDGIYLVVSFLGFDYILDE